jgi:hypothetical protein
MKTVVIKFRKIRKFRCADPFDTAYSCITGGSIMNVAIDLARSLEGYVKSFREKNPDEFFNCKLVVKLPQENELKFINDFVKELRGHIENIRW